MKCPIFLAPGARLALASALLFAAPAASAPPAVAVCHPRERDTSHHDYGGRLEPADPVEVRAPAAGTVRKVRVRPGDRVRKGDPLFECEWSSAAGAVPSAGDAVRRANEEFERLKAAHREAERLSKSAPADLTKQYEDALAGLKAPLEKALERAAAALRSGLPPARRDAVQRLYAAIDSTLRLAKARSAPARDVDYESELSRLRALILRDPAAPGTTESGEQFGAALQELVNATDHVCMLSRARSEEGLAALAAERDLAATKLKVVRANAAAERRTAPGPEVVAPDTARVLRVAVHEGDCLESLRKLAREGKVPGGSTEGVPVAFGLSKETGFPHEGHLAFVGTRLDPETHRAHCRASFPDGDGALAEAAVAGGKAAQVRVRLSVGGPSKVWLVPARAVLTDSAGKTQVLVVDDQNRVRVRPVSAGPESGGLREVSSGLSASDRVVVGSGAAAKDGATATLSPEDFVRDLRLMNLTPDTTVEPVVVELPARTEGQRPQP